MPYPGSLCRSCYDSQRLRLAKSTDEAEHAARMPPLGLRRNQRQLLKSLKQKLLLK